MAHHQYLEDLSSEIRSFAVFFIALMLVYGTWLMVFWPGVLGPDSLAILLEVENPKTFGSDKTAFWYDYVMLLYKHNQLAELPIGLIMILSAIIMARILGWCWSRRFIGITVFLLIFICLAPHLIYSIGLLYPDGIFSIAIAGFLFETWMISRQREANFLSLIIIAITFPFATFVRTNGIIFLIPAVALIFMVNRAKQFWIGAIIVGWCGLAGIGIYNHKHESHEIIYPLAIYETINFLQPRPMDFSTEKPRISQQTIDALTQSHPLELYLNHYDPDYWDPLNYDSSGPRVMALPQHDQNVITKEFFRYNLWHNIPKFIGSRVNIFLVAAMAQGGYYGLIPPDTFSKFILNKVKSKSIYRKFKLNKIEYILKIFHEYNWIYRWLLWTPFIGIGLMIWMLYTGIRKQNTPFLLVSIPMMIELIGIFIFSVAGEYRYLLPFFTLPLVLLPIIIVNYTNKTEKPSQI